MRIGRSLEKLIARCVPGERLTRRVMNIRFWRAVRRMGRRLGLHITKSYGWPPEKITQSGSHPATVIDVGVGDGTPQLYEAFPDAHFVLIEPVAEFADSIGKVLTRYKGEYHCAAAGSSIGSISIDLPTASFQGSRLRLGETSGLDTTAIESRTVPMVTIDSLLAEKNWTPPFGLKIDTEGAELEVIRGATEFLKQTDFIIAEVAMKDGVCGYDFLSFVQAMDERGFVTYEFLELIHHPVTGVLECADVLFVRR